MKKHILFALALVLACGLSGCSSDSSRYDKEYEAGRSYGYEEGYSDGWDEGWNNGRVGALDESRVEAEGLADAAYEVGYEDGHYDGYKERIAIVEQNYFEKYSYAVKLVEYVKNHSDDPEKYLHEYDSIWGDLTRSHGDIIFDTLTEAQRSLVHFSDTSLDRSIEWASGYTLEGENSFHYIENCYTLLASNLPEDIKLVNAIDMGLKPCSACVPDEYYYLP